MQEIARRTNTVVQEASRVVLMPRSSCKSESEPGCAKPTQTPTLFIVLAVTYV